MEGGPAGAGSIVPQQRKAEWGSRRLDRYQIRIRHIMEYSSTVGFVRKEQRPDEKMAADI
jgi:hypothetical protein